MYGFGREGSLSEHVPPQEAAVMPARRMGTSLRHLCSADPGATSRLVCPFGPGNGAGPTRHPQSAPRGNHVTMPGQGGLLKMFG